MPSGSEEHDGATDSDSDKYDEALGEIDTLRVRAPLVTSHKGFRPCPWKAQV